MLLLLPPLQVQQDELKPRPIESFRGRILALPDGVVSSDQPRSAALSRWYQHLHHVVSCKVCCRCSPLSEPQTVLNVHINIHCIAAACCCLQCGAGGTSTFCVATGPQLYSWGKLKVSGDNTTHPMPVEDLSGWNVSTLGCLAFVTSL